jgi:hypothetical protein
VSEGGREGVSECCFSYADVCVCVCVWLVSVGGVYSARVGGLQWSRGRDEGAAAGGG